MAAAQVPGTYTIAPAKTAGRGCPGFTALTGQTIDITTSGTTLNFTLLGEQLAADYDAAASTFSAPDVSGRFTSGAGGAVQLQMRVTQGACTVTITSTRTGAA